MRAIASISLILSLLATFVVAWHPTGHFVVARIAEIEIKKNNAALYGKLVTLLKDFGKHTKEKDHPFVECACFPDDIKYIGWKAFNQFHFYDHYLLGPGKKPEDLKGLPKSRVNMASSLADARETLKNMKSSQVDDRFGKSFELRYLIHLVGDVHQPLHAVSRVSTDHPKGDAGGNAFKLSEPKIDLHTLWDKTVGAYTDVRAPLEGRGWDVIEGISTELMKKFPRDSLVEELKVKDVSKWIMESKGLAKEYAYKGVEEGGKVTQAYRDRARPIIDKQLILGGYRLADMLLEMFAGVDLEEMFKSHQKGGAAVTDEESDADANNSALVEMSDEEGDKNAAKNQEKAGDNKPAAKKNDPKAQVVPADKKPAKKKDDGKLLVDKKRKAPAKKKRFDEDEYSPEDESDYDEQREAEEPTSDVEEEETQNPGFFSRVASSIRGFFGRLFYF